jgi:hypothetical protein
MLNTLIPLPWQRIVFEWCGCNYRNAWTVKEYCSLFIGTGHSLWGITIMPLIKVYNIDSDLYGLKGHSIFKSVRPFTFGYVVLPKLHEWYLRRHVRAASAEAVSFCRTFGDEAWSQQLLFIITIHWHYSPSLLFSITIHHRYCSSMISSNFFVVTIHRYYSSLLFID